MCFSECDGEPHSVVLNEAPHEVEQGSNSIIVKGRLKSHVEFWKLIGASQFIINTISNGYVIPFVHTPPRASFLNNQSAFQHKEFVASAIGDLLKVGSIVECLNAPVVVNPLSVSVQTSGKKRLILDLRYPNSFLKKFKIKFERVQSMLQLLIDPIQSWLFSFDIKSGYHHIDIFENDQEFLGLSWPYQGKVHYFKFTVLPFGLATGPYIFTKVMRSLVKHWRGQAYRIVVYLDDGLGAFPSFDSALQRSSSVRADLVNCGFHCSQ